MKCLRIALAQSHYAQSHGGACADDIAALTDGAFLVVDEVLSAGEREDGPAGLEGETGKTLEELMARQEDYVAGAGK